MNSVADIWKIVLSRMSQDLSETTISTWFDEVEAVSVKDRTLYLHCPNDFKRSTIESMFMDRIKDSLKDIYSADFDVKLLSTAESTAMFEPESKKNTTLLDSGDQLDEATRTQLLENIRDESNWLVSVVENLLSVTRIDSEKVTVQKTPTVLDELLDTVLVKFRKRYPEIPVELETPDAFIVIPMDSMLIQQVLMNLLENAALHAEGMTKLTLRVFTMGGRAVFEVSDDGCGIPKEKLKKLFTGMVVSDMDAPADSGKHGMGIGLSVCAAIIKAHGGEIKAESAPGEGTTIRFWLEAEEIEMEDAEDEQ